MLLHYITDRTQFPGDEAERRRRLQEKIAEAARCSVDYIQLREKDLSARELETLARQAAQIVRNETRLLINSRTDIAFAVGAAGVHLRSDDSSPSEVRKIWQQCGAETPSTSLRAGPACETSYPNPTVSVSCHSSDEVGNAARDKADFAVFAPVFEKHAAPEAEPAGLEALRLACRHGIPVFALGGITLQNARQCLSAGRPASPPSACSRIMRSPKSCARCAPSPTLKSLPFPPINPRVWLFLDLNFSGQQNALLARLLHELDEDNPMNIDDAISAHSSWKMKLSAYLSHPDRSLKAATVGASNGCELGKWLNGEGHKYSKLPEFAKLVADHARFHKAAAGVVEKADTGQRVTEEIALGSKSEFASASAAVVKSLMAMKAHV